MKTYNDIYLDVRRRLRESGVEAYELEAMLIVCVSSGKSRERFLRDMRMFAGDNTCERKANGAVERRVNGEPLAYILGEWEFYGLPIRVSRDVMIPRVDTEVLAREGIALASRAGQSARVMDLCAGCGCVGLAIAANVKSCRVVFVEKSARALDLCRENIARTAPARNTACIQADALEKPPVMQGGYNLIACNPPYIPAGDISRLDDSVRLYEPRAALDGGADGLDFFRAVTERWTALLLKGGHLAFECGAGQTGAVSKIMAARGFTNIRVTDDTAGIGRVVIGKL